MSSSDPFTPLIAAVEQADSAALLFQATRELAGALAIQSRDPMQGSPPAAALSCLVQILGFNNPGAAVAAVEGLIASGPAAVTPLLEGLDGQNYGARAWAVRALAGIGDVRGLELLEQALSEDIGPSVRRAAAIGLGTLRLGDLALPERPSIEERALAALERGRHDGEWVVRYAVATAMEKLALRLQELEEGQRRAVASLCSLADHSCEEVPVVRLRAKLALSRLTSP
ncbi:MAG: HEAT repeat domain-containing protein [Cyanobacteriota bacterium]|jgi:phycocyanobilin lyase beta subunit